jgi:hypothetical protein
MIVIPLFFQVKLHLPIEHIHLPIARANIFTLFPTEMGFTTPIFYWAQAQPNQISTPDWGMLGVLIGLISLLAAIIIGIAQIRAAQRPKKDIRCRLIASAPLLKFDDRFKGHLQVTFQGQEIKDASSIVLRIHNAGKVAITPTDFVRPIIFMFASSTEIINAEILKTEPQNLGAKLSITKNSIELQPLLMNSGDSIDISSLVASFDDNLTVDGRVVDVKMIRLEEEFESSDEKLEDFQEMSEKLVGFLLVVLFMAFLSFFRNEGKNGFLLELYQQFLNNR